MCLLSWDLRNSRLALDLSERNYSVNLNIHVRFRPTLRTDIVYSTVWSSSLTAAEAHWTVCILYTCCGYHMSAMLHTLGMFAVIFHAVILCDFILISPMNFCDRTYPNGLHIHQLHCALFNKGNTSM